MILSLGAWAAFAAPAQAGPIDFTVRAVSSDGTPILSIVDADKLLLGQIPSATDATAQTGVVNFNEPDNPVGGHFGGDSPFPGIAIGHEKNFAAEITGFVSIPKAGDYTFGVSSDDGFALQIGTFSMAHPGLRSPGSTYSTFNFSNAGSYAVDLVFFQHDVNAELELFASPGRFTAIGQTGSNFQLVGDSASGGLTAAEGVSTPLPEPSGILLLAPLMMGLLLGRRRGEFRNGRVTVSRCGV
jgi:hypothetical protein